MNHIKTIIYCDMKCNFEKLHNECKKHFGEPRVIKDPDDLGKEVLKSKGSFNLVFIESSLLDSIDEHIVTLLKNENCFCVVFSNHNDLDHLFIEYINDYLLCDNGLKVENFFKRLNLNLSERFKLMEKYDSFNGFYDIAKQLSVEKDMTSLFNLILDHCMTTTKSDAGTLFLIVDEDKEKFTFYEKNSKTNHLKFMIAKNNSLQVDLVSTTMEITSKSIIGSSVKKGLPIRIDDVYDIVEDTNYQFDNGFDKKTGYQTKSILTIPMKDHEDRVIGVIQLINKMRGVEILPFTKEDESIIFSLAGLGAVVIENSILYRDLNKLIEANRDKVHVEIEKRKKADEEIDKLLSAVELSPVSVMITDIKGAIQYVNPKFELLTNYSSSEVLGKNPRFLKSGLYDDDYYASLWSTILSGKDWHGELYNKKKDGKFYWSNYHIASVKDEYGEIKYFVSVQEDVTDRKRLNATIKEKNIELEETIEQLNLSKMQVIQSEKLAGIGQLAAGIAHEINNPLSFVVNNFSWLGESIDEMKSTLSEFIKAFDISDGIMSHKILKYKDDLDSITSEIKEILNESNIGLMRVITIIKALRIFSTIDQFEDYEYYDFKLNLENTLLLMKGEFGDIEIQRDFEEVPMIKVVAKEMNQVLLNLLKNSIYAVKEKFENLSEGCITLKTYADEDNLFFTITDNGSGIDEALLNRIFEPFFTTKPVGTGPGLGLSVAYDVIEKRHHGIITCASEVGVGTVFLITIPLTEN
ncbi:MAG: PAS domain S-box protein [Clostridiales bacterium]|nr:PAS domain S-box protein [Clostridiales bacterium]